MKRAVLGLALILLLALALRGVALTAVPPGLTHDEANHGREALGVLDGVYLFYFPLNYGSEPLYSYTVALSMWLFGEGLFALRLVNVFFGVAAIGLTALWGARAFGRETAVLAAALYAVSFWPLASSREALRAGMLPFFTAAAIWFFWLIVTNESSEKSLFNRGGRAERESPEKNSALSAPSAVGFFSGRTNEKSGNRRWWLAAAFGAAVAFTLHIYLAARVAWLIFPLFLLYLALIHRPMFRHAWGPTLAGLLLAGLLVIPMFVYLQLHPEALTRLDMLDRPLQDLRAGNFGPALRNVSGALLAFVWPGAGDRFLAYNIPGRPVFEAVTAVFFLLGLAVSFWRWRSPAHALLLLWFAVGILPSLITGATANTTRNMAAQPAVMLLPAVGFVGLADWLRARFGTPTTARGLRPFTIAALLWLLVAGIVSGYDYFWRWAQDPDVRGAYQVNLMAALAYLEERETAPPILLSTVYPGPAHDPSIALVMRPHAAADLHWVDARGALLWPGGGAAQAIIPGSTPPHPAFAPYLRLIETRELRPTDLDPSFDVYALRPLEGVEETAVANFNGAVELLSAEWLEGEVNGGETAVIRTTWRVLDPAQAGPPVPPSFTPDTVLFTQLLTPEGGVLSQQDRLDAPAWNWQTGDIFQQIHSILIPPDTPPGAYRAIVGFYSQSTLERLPTLAPDGSPGETFANAPPLMVR